MLVVNLFGGPGSGKSTLAAGLFFRLKCSGQAVELVTEYAKDVTWENRTNLLDDQLYLLAKQNRRLGRLLEHPIKLAITDSPVLLCAAYARLNGTTNNLPSFDALVQEVFNSYNNVNIVLERDPSTYSGLGRSQTIDEAAHIDDLVVAMLDEFNIPYDRLRVGSDDSVAEVLDLLSRKLSTVTQK